MNVKKEGLSMKLTLAEANRKAQQLKLECSRILREEENTCTYAHG